jgi:hypothetical protein
MNLLQTKPVQRRLPKHTVHWIMTRNVKLSFLEVSGSDFEIYRECHLLDKSEITFLNINSCRQLNLTEHNIINLVNDCPKLLSLECCNTDCFNDNVMSEIRVKILHRLTVFHIIACPTLFTARSVKYITANCHILFDIQFGMRSFSGSDEMHLAKLIESNPVCNIVLSLAGHFKRTPSSSSTDSAVLAAVGQFCPMVTQLHYTNFMCLKIRCVVHLVRRCVHLSDLRATVSGAANTQSPITETRHLALAKPCASLLSELPRATLTAI